MASYESKIVGYRPQFNPNIQLGDVITIDTTPVSEKFEQSKQSLKRMQNGGDISYIKTVNRR